MDGQGNNQNGQQQQFQLEDAARCEALDVDDEALQYYYYQNNKNGNNMYQNYNQQGGGNGEMRLFVGPYCAANGKSIHLGAFLDETCSYAAPGGMYEKFHYGQALPYASDNLIDQNCLSCTAPDENGNNNQNNNNNGNNDNNQNGNNNYNYYDNDDQEAEVLEMCESLYEDAGKCEANLADGVTYYPNTVACDFIRTLRRPGKMPGTTRSAVPASRVFAGLFAATTVAFAGVAYVLHAKAQRSGVDLSGADGGTLA